MQAAYFIIVDIVPMSALFNLHHKMYGENANRAGVRMQQDPELARAQNMQQTEELYVRAFLDNVVDGTE